MLYLKGVLDNIYKVHQRVYERETPGIRRPKNHDTTTNSFLAPQQPESFKKAPWDVEFSRGMPSVSYER